LATAWWRRQERGGSGVDGVSTPALSSLAVVAVAAWHQRGGGGGGNGGGTIYNQLKVSGVGNGDDDSNNDKDKHDCNGG
jgi:hypothetical protein